MATTASKRRRNKAKDRKKKNNNQRVTIGAAVLTLALLAFGLFQFYSNSQTAAGNSALIQTESSSLESVSIDGDHSNAPQPVAATDRETRFLGPASDAESVALAEAGQLGQPTLLWFHADW